MNKSSAENRLSSVGRCAGRFAPLGDEKLGKTTGVRLPLSLQNELEEFLQTSNKTKRELLTEWIKEGLENAIASGDDHAAS